MLQLGDFEFAYVAAIQKPLSRQLRDLVHRFTKVLLVVLMNRCHDAPDFTHLAVKLGGERLRKQTLDCNRHAADMTEFAGLDKSRSRSVAPRAG